MVLPRASPLKGAFRQSTARNAGARARSQNWRSNGRRFYADSHAPKKASSDLPWLIGSLVVTVPSATWLWQQGPKKGEHSHGHGEAHEVHKESEEDQEKPEGEESKDENEDDSKKEKADTSDDSKDEDKSEDSSSDDGDDKGEDTPSTTDDEGKGPGEGQKGGRKPTEKKGEKDSHKDESGAQNPYLNDPEKSKKGEGITDSAKIRGTVDPQRNVRGPKDKGTGAPEKEGKGKEQPSDVQA